MLKYLLLTLFIICFSLSKNTYARSLLGGDDLLANCQLDSSTSWIEHIKAIKNGSDLTAYTFSSWKERASALETRKVEDYIAIADATKKMTLQRDCAALASYMQRTPTKFKPDLNQAEKDMSFDQKLSCNYPNALSQDYKACEQARRDHNTFIVREVKMLDAQEEKFKKFKKSEIKNVKNSGDIQKNSYAASRKSYSNLSAHNGKRISLQKERIGALKKRLSEIPTKKDLLSECNQMSSAYTQLGHLEFKAMAHRFAAYDEAIPPVRPSCEAVMEMKEQHLLTNQESIKQLARIIKYEEKKLRYLNGEEKEIQNEKQSIAVAKGNIAAWIETSSGNCEDEDASLCSGGEFNYLKKLKANKALRLTGNIKAKERTSLRKGHLGKNAKPNATSQLKIGYRDEAVLKGARKNGQDEKQTDFQQNSYKKGAIFEDSRQGTNLNSSDAQLAKEGKGRIAREADGGDSFASTFGAIRGMASVGPNGIRRGEDGVLRYRSGKVVFFPTSSKESSLFKILSNRYSIIKSNGRL